MAETVGNKTEKPRVKPSSPNFGSGPCAKRPGYDLDVSKLPVLGRSHRSALGKGRIVKAIELSRKILGIPDDYLLGIVPASDTGAVEMAMWSMLGPRPVDVCSWETFGHGWLIDATQQLPLLQGVRDLSAPYGELPDMSQVDPVHDVIFTWNGTTSGVKVANTDWISDKREGIVICDATSAVFAMEMDWKKLDVVTYSWQKVLGGEAAHGVLILSPRAVDRLETYTPPWPMPKIFRLTNRVTGHLLKEIFEGSVINTVSMLCVEDYIDALEWAESIGGLKELIRRSKENLSIIEAFVEKNDWISFLAKDPAVRSNTSVCLQLKCSNDQVKKITKLLENEKVAYDIDSYRDAPPGLRIWCGSTVQADNLRALLPWISWAYHEVVQH